ncbi:MAG TPA: YhbY family RNA-binding protein [Chondromyces sp.]|nr:YhbY family RNA-binding protein [Chondromyces sp.]
MLTGSERKHLRGLAHGYRPVVQVGKGGLTDPVVASIDQALAARELIKVQIFTARDERQEIASAIEERLACVCVGLIGRMAILYRQQPDPEQRHIKVV